MRIELFPPQPSKRLLFTSSSLTLHICHFGVAAGCIPFVYHLLTISLPVSDQVLHEQNRQQDMRGAILGLLVFGYHFRTISVPFFTWAGLTTRCEGSHFGVAGVCPPCPYQFLSISLPIAARAETTAICEGSHFGVAGVGIPFPYHFLSISLPFPYQLLHEQK